MEVVIRFVEDWYAEAAGYLILKNPVYSYHVASSWEQRMSRRE